MNSYPNKKLEIINVSKSFEDLRVLENITIDLKKGEFVSILGPSGSGKSTLFNIIAGLLSPDHGKVMIEGEDFTGQTGQVAYMYQKDLLLPWKTMIENVAMPLLIKGENKKAAFDYVRPYFKTFGLEGFEDKYPRQLSGGMRQRGALLRTYMFSNDVILLDEPFGGLDAITKHKMQDWLLGILDQLQASVLFITHDVDEAIVLSDRIYVLSKRPAKVKGIMEVHLEAGKEKPLYETRGYNELKKSILELL